MYISTCSMIKLGKMNRKTREPQARGQGRRYVAIDYGTTNLCAFPDVWDDGKTFWITNEYYWDSAAKWRQKTDHEYAEDLEIFLDGDREAQLILDPGVASIRMELRNRGFRIIGAENEVREGTVLLHITCRTRKDRPAVPRCAMEKHERTVPLCAVNIFIQS